MVGPRWATGVWGGKRKNCGVEPDLAGRPVLPLSLVHWCTRSRALARSHFCGTMLGRVIKKRIRAVRVKVADMAAGSSDGKQNATQKKSIRGKTRLAGPAWTIKRSYLGRALVRHSRLPSLPKPTRGRPNRLFRSTQQFEFDSYAMPSE